MHTGQRRSFRISPRLSFGGHVLLELNPSASLMASTCDGSVTLWDTNEFQEVFTFKGHQLGKESHGLCWDHSGRNLATASFDKTAIIWDTQERRLLQRFHGVDQSQFFGFSGDDSRFMTTANGSLNIWHVESGRELANLPLNSNASAVFESFQSNDRELGNETEPTTFLAIRKLQSSANLPKQADGIPASFRLAAAKEALLRPYIQSHDPQRAIKELDRILSIQPLHPESLSLRALAAYRIGEFQNGLDWLDRLAKDDRLDSQIVRYLCSQGLNPESGAQIKQRSMKKVEETNEVPQSLFRLLGELVSSEVTPDGGAEVVVTSLADDLRFNDGAISLREAIARIEPGGTIRFDVAGKIDLRIGPLVVEKPMTIIGPGVDHPTLDGQYRMASFVVDDHDSEQDSAVTISNNAYY